MKLILLFMLILIIGCATPKEKCEDKAGKFLQEYNECEGITSQDCDNMGGVYDDCASACRHTKADVCIQVCVPVCKLE